MYELKSKEITRYITSSEQDTFALGRKLAAELGVGDRIGIVGPLGAGKTVLVRGIAAGLGISSDLVSSPTFAIVNTYESVFQVLHVDLYRVSDIDEVEATGLLDLADDAVVLIEWIDRVPELLEAGSIRIEIEDLGGDKRSLLVSRMAAATR